MKRDNEYEEGGHACPLFLWWDFLGIMSKTDGSWWLEKELNNVVYDEDN